VFRVCSVDVIHLSFELAKAACAADAIAEGILDFIMFGNGQTAPAEKRLFEPQQDDAMSAAPPVTLTLQGFFEVFPRPLPEPVDDKTVAEINAPGWLNTLIQSVAESSSTSSFGRPTPNLGGMSYPFPLFALLSLLPMYHPSPVSLAWPTAAFCDLLVLARSAHTDMVVPQFPKRADAKNALNAVCLAALAAGVGTSVRAISAALEVRITEKCFWSVATDFRNRNDAKVAVVHVAFEQGAIEFLRFKGESPPEGHKVELPPTARVQKSEMESRGWNRKRGRTS
jgi:hypothetical protein